MTRLALVMLAACATPQTPTRSAPAAAEPTIEDGREVEMVDEMPSCASFPDGDSLCARSSTACERNLRLISIEDTSCESLLGMACFLSSDQMTGIEQESCLKDIKGCESATVRFRHGLGGGSPHVIRRECYVVRFRRR